MNSIVDSLRVSNVRQQTAYRDNTNRGSKVA